MSGHWTRTLSSQFCSNWFRNLEIKALQHELKQTKSQMWFQSMSKLQRSFIHSVQFSRSVCPTLCDPMNCSTPGLPVHQQLPKSTQTHVHWVSDAIQPSHPLLSPSPLALNLSQHQDLFQWVSSLHQVAKVLDFQLQHHFWWIYRVDFL